MWTERKQLGITMPVRTSVGRSLLSVQAAFPFWSSFLILTRNEKLCLDAKFSLYVFINPN